MTGRIVRSADFERVLRTAPRAKSPHFALHHLVGAPLRRAVKAPVEVKLSTEVEASPTRPVDESVLTPPAGRVWVGTVIPKRHARRSVTRSLLKRQIHAAVGRQADMREGLWVIRLRAPIETSRFTSAASTVLAESMRQELDAVLANLMRRLPAG